MTVVLAFMAALAATAAFIVWMGLLVASSGWMLVAGVVVGATLLLGTVLMWRIVIEAVFEYFD